MRIIKIITLYTIFNIAIVQAADSAQDGVFPSSWEPLVGSQNLQNVFVGNANVPLYLSNGVRVLKLPYAINIAEDNSRFETLENPANKEQFQKYKLIPEGLRFELKFNHRKHFKGELTSFEEIVEENSIVWKFEGEYQDTKSIKKVTHIFVFEKSGWSLIIKTFFDNKMHAEVVLYPVQKSMFFMSQSRK